MPIQIPGYPFNTADPLAHETLNAIVEALLANGLAVVPGVPFVRTRGGVVQLGRPATGGGGTSGGSTDFWVISGSAGIAAATAATANPVDWGEGDVTQVGTSVVRQAWNRWLTPVPANRLINCTWDGGTAHYIVRVWDCADIPG